MAENYNSAQDLLEQLTQLSSITETYTLPTKGQLDGIGPEVTLRMMTTHEEKIRTGSKSSSYWRTISSIINNCIVEPKGLDSYKLTVIDFIFLMYKLRIVSYGSDYRVNLPMCPFCNQKLTDVSVDLDKLPLVYIDEMEKPYSEPYEITLPKTKWTVGCRLLRICEFDEIEREASDLLEKFPNYEGDPMVPLRLSRQIVTINGQKLERTSIRTIVDNLPAADANKITRELEKIDMGLSLESEYTCPKCGKKIPIVLTFSEEFFRPTSD